MYIKSKRYKAHKKGKMYTNGCLVPRLSLCVNENFKNAALNSYTAIIVAGGKR